MIGAFMNIYDSQLYLQDLDYTLSNCSWIRDLSGKSILITGATGLICSPIIDLLCRYNEKKEQKIHIYAAGRSKEKISARFSYCFDAPYFSYIEYDATNPKNTLDFSVNYIIHGASNAYPELIQAEPVETMQSNFNGIFELLKYAKSKNVQNTVFISSSEVYGLKSTETPSLEDEYGYIDILNPRSSYSVGKQAAETLCASFASEKDVSVSIARPGHIYGPTANSNDNRVSSSFAYEVVYGNDLILKSDGSQIRSYCYMLDCATAILKILLNGKSGEAYNISNPDSIINIKTLAELYAKIGSVSVLYQKPTLKEAAAFNPMKNSSLNSKKLQELGWRGLFDAETGTEHTIKILTELCNITNVKN